MGSPHSQSQPRYWPRSVGSMTWTVRQVSFSSRMYNSMNSCWIDCVVVVAGIQGP
ncbi:hypothetical protein BJY04DRAFT_175494 [Aspergillus karnatakaensis]|uniref:uncharacterized protein n=1 Tax=Aspergillus karnatakaensis TaxID=1810916 RepID=UPI003CCCAA6B